MRLLSTMIMSALICLLIGYGGSWVQIEALHVWYPTLIKSPLTPPRIAFPIVWSILYVMMGASVAFIIHSTTKKRCSICINLFLAQMIFNFLWSFLFFYLQNPLLGLIDIIILDILVIAYIWKSYSISRVSSYLFIPYILWLLLATYLNLYIWIYN